jgi:hypothetical protein
MRISLGLAENWDDSPRKPAKSENRPVNEADRSG